MKVDLEAKVEANVTNLIDNVTNEVIIPPTKEISDGVTKLLSVATTFIDNITYKYIENSKIKKQQFLENLEKKYNSIPKDNVEEPDILILGNSLDSLKFCLDKDYLVELYTNIMISDMDNRTKNDVHISYVEILKQLSYDDLNILEAIYKNKNTKSMALGKVNIVDSNNKSINLELHNSIYLADINNYLIKDYNVFSKSIENLNRLGLIEISYIKYFREKNIYDDLLAKFKPSAVHVLHGIQREYSDAKFGCENGILSISILGYDLMKICLRDI